MAPPGPSILPLQGHRAAPCGPHTHDPHPGNSTRLIAPQRKQRRLRLPRRCQCLNFSQPAWNVSAISFKLTALKGPGSTNQVTRRLSKEPIRAKSRLSWPSPVARAPKKKKTAASEKEGGRAQTESMRKRCLASRESIVLLFLVIRDLLLALSWFLLPPSISTNILVYANS